MYKPRAPKAIWEAEIGESLEANRSTSLETQKKKKKDLSQTSWEAKTDTSSLTFTHIKHTHTYVLFIHIFTHKFFLIYIKCYSSKDDTLLFMCVQVQTCMC